MFFEGKAFVRCEARGNRLKTAVLQKKISARISVKFKKWRHGTKGKGEHQKDIELFRLEYRSMGKILT